MRARRIKIVRSILRGEHAMTNFAIGCFARVANECEYAASLRFGQVAILVDAFDQHREVLRLTKLLREFVRGRRQPVIIDATVFKYSLLLHQAASAPAPTMPVVATAVVQRASFGFLGTTQRHRDRPTQGLVIDTCPRQRIQRMYQQAKFALPLRKPGVFTLREFHGLHSLRQGAQALATQVGSRFIIGGKFEQAIQGVHLGLGIAGF